MERPVPERDEVSFYPGARSDAPIVMLPGLIAGSWMWDSALRTLTDRGYSCFTIRDAIAVNYASVDAAVDFVSEHLDRRGIERVTLFGASLGSIVALTFALRRPERVDLVLLSGAPTLGRPAELGIAATGKLTRSIAFDLANRLFYDRACIDDEFVEHTFRLFLNRRRLLNAVRLLRECNAFDITGALDKLDVDVLMVWGEDDTISRCEDWERLVPFVRRGTFVKIPRCGHTPMIERPDEFDALVLDYLASRSGAQPGGSS